MNNDFVDINQYRAAMDKTKIFHIDSNGDRWECYVCDYTDMDGYVFGVNIYAKSLHDAEQRLRSIGTSGVVRGVLYEEFSG